MALYAVKQIGKVTKSNSLAKMTKHLVSVSWPLKILYTKQPSYKSLKRCVNSRWLLTRNNFYSPSLAMAFSRIFPIAKCHEKRCLKCVWAAPRKIVLRAYADSEGPDQPAHPHSLILAFPVRKQNQWIPKNVSVGRKCPYETLHKCRMMLIRTFCACSKARFRLGRPICEW